MLSSMLWHVQKVGAKVIKTHIIIILWDFIFIVFSIISITDILHLFYDMLTTFVAIVFLY